MCLVSVRGLGRMLVRSVSATVVRIALGAMLTTPQPAVASQIVAGTPVTQAAPAGGNDTSATPDGQTPTPEFVGVGPGWG